MIREVGIASQGCNEGRARSFLAAKRGGFCAGAADFDKFNLALSRRRVLASAPLQKTRRFLMYRIIGADGQQYGPVSAVQMRQWIAEGRVNAQTMALSEGESQWKPAGVIGDFAASFGQAIPTVVPPPSPAYTMLGAAHYAGRKPGKLQAVGIMMLVSGILSGLGALTYLVLTPFFCITLVPAIYYTVLCILEIQAAVNLMPDPIKPSPPPRAAAITQIVAAIFCDALTLAVGIISLVFLNDEEVRAYYRSRIGY
jgi:hypothetical protein